MAWCGIKNKFSGDLKMCAQDFLAGASKKYVEVNICLQALCSSYGRVYTCRSFTEGFHRLCVLVCIWIGLSVMCPTLLQSHF